MAAETIRLVYPENDIVTYAPKVHGAELFAAEITLKNWTDEDRMRCQRISAEFVEWDKLTADVG